jgi:hypothetical protein
MGSFGKIALFSLVPCCRTSTQRRKGAKAQREEFLFFPFASLRLRVFALKSASLPHEYGLEHLNINSSHFHKTIIF